jgi:hypothetical protein
MLFKSQSIFINKKYLEDYDLLGQKGLKNRDRSPFIDRSFVFMAAVAYGFLSGKHKPIPLGKLSHELFKTSTFSHADCVILRTLFLLKNDMKFDENYNDKEICRMAMEWAEAGFVELKAKTLEDKSDNNLNLVYEELGFK